MMNETNQNVAIRTGPIPLLLVNADDRADVPCQNPSFCRPGPFLLRPEGAIFRVKLRPRFVLSQAFPCTRCVGLMR